MFATVALLFWGAQERYPEHATLVKQIVTSRLKKTHDCSQGCWLVSGLVRSPMIVGVLACVRSLTWIERTSPARRPLNLSSASHALYGSETSSMSLEPLRW